MPAGHWCEVGGLMLFLSNNLTKDLTANLTVAAKLCVLCPTKELKAWIWAIQVDVHPHEINRRVLPLKSGDRTCRELAVLCDIFT